MAILNTVAQFGRYMLRSRLATGGASEVWIAEIDGAAAGTSPLVFKKLRSELAQNPELVESFAQRARRSTLLRHDCIARVSDVVVSRDECGFAMEYVDGKTLRQLVSAVGGAGNALPVWFAIHVARRVCQALEHAHTGVDADGQPLRIAHENLSPENVFLTFLGQVKVADFGLSYAALLRGGGEGPDESMRFRGGTGWCEPLTGTIDTVRNDLDGIGRLLYELLTGICPPSHDVARGEFLPPSHYAPWVNVEVDQLLARMLAPAHPKRFQTASEIRSALDEYLSARRHDVTATHIAGLVSVLFSAECRDSAPPTMRLKEGAVELAMLRSRRTSPPDLERRNAPRVDSTSDTPAPALSSHQFSRQTMPSLAVTEPAEPTRPSAAEAPSAPTSSGPVESVSSAKLSITGEARTGPFHHDWDLALKRAREEAQANQKPSGVIPTAASIAHPEPATDPLEQAVKEFEQGLEHMRRGEFQGALQAWERALEFDPQHRVCRANLNLLKKRLGSQP